MRKWITYAGFALGGLCAIRVLWLGEPDYLYGAVIIGLLPYWFLQREEDLAPPNVHDWRCGPTCRCKQR